MPEIPQDLQGLSPEQIIELQKKQCIFCKIISGEIPSNKVYEDKDTLVILDINPANEGHCLVLPKKHYQIMPQIPEDEIGKLFAIAKKTSHALLKGLSVSGTSVFVANGALAGQKAPHFMIHVVPRKKGDGLFNIPKNNINEEELNSAMELFRKRLSPAVESKKQTGIKEPVEKQDTSLKPETIEVEDIEETETTENLDLENLADALSSEKKDNKKKDKDEKKEEKEKKKNPIDIDKISQLFS
ncbi:HIT family protein [Candidatus Woesearchaeota archaeon]|nr:HIT family protein [Candidatus Woesearchaeota archaeon]